MIVVAVLILLPPLVWALSTLNIVAAMSIGGILLVVAIVVLFIKIKDQVDEER